MANNSIRNAFQYFWQQVLYKVSSKTAEHNTDQNAHEDIRTSLASLSTQVNNFLDVDDTTKDQLSEIIAMIENSNSLEELQQLLTQYVKYTDVIDNLTSSVTNKPLSANQGKVLKQLIDNLTSLVNNKAPSVHTHEWSNDTFPGELVIYCGTSTELID